MTTLNILIITPEVIDIWEYKPFGGETKSIKQIINDASKIAKAGVKNTASTLKYDSHYPFHIKNVQEIDDEMHKKIAHEMRSTLIDCVVFDSENDDAMRMITIFVSGNDSERKMAYIIDNDAYKQHSQRILLKRIPVKDDVILTAFLALELLRTDDRNYLDYFWTFNMR